MDFLGSGRHRLQQEEHSPGEVSVVVTIQSDVLHELFAEDRVAEHTLLPGRSIEDVRHCLDGRLNGWPFRAVDKDHEVVIAPRRDLGSTPRAHENDGDVRVVFESGESRDPLAEPRIGSYARAQEAREVPASRGAELLNRALGPVLHCQALVRSWRRFEDPWHVHAAFEHRAEQLLVFFGKRNVVKLRGERAEMHMPKPIAEAIEKVARDRHGGIHRPGVRNVKAKASFGQLFEC